MKKSLFCYSLSMLFLSAILAGMNACSKKKDDTSSPAVVAPTSNMLKSALKGKPFSTGYINDFVLAEKDQQVVMMAANNATGMVYAIDLEDGDATQAATNAITSPVNNFGAQLALALGVPANQLSILNMEINPVSKSIYLLISNTSSNATAVVKVTNKGTTFKVIDLSNVSYVAIPFSTIGEMVNDITWGDNTIFLSYSHPTTLVGKIATAQAPFEQNEVMINRSTTVFKTNWGSTYFTNAPLETMCYAEIGNEKRLMGVTVCAPGFSFKTSDISDGSGLLQVKEYFNLNTGSAVKVYPVLKNSKTYLIEHHFDGRIALVGQKYIDGTQTQVNANAKYLLEFNGSRKAGLTDDDVRIIDAGSNYIISAKNSDSQLLVFGSTGVLSLLAF
jgi:hypothetical protein